jgi:hypothetical protein
MAMNGPKQEYAAASRIFNILEKQSFNARKRILDIVSEQLLETRPQLAVDPRQTELPVVTTGVADGPVLAGDGF